MKRLSIHVLLSLAFSLAAPVCLNAQTFTGRLLARSQNFSFQCNGLNQTIVLSAFSFPSNATVANIVGAEIALFENHGGLQYVRANATFGGDSLVSLSIADNQVTNFFSQGVFQIAITSGGSVLLPPMNGACNPGFGQVQGTLTLWFLAS